MYEIIIKETKTVLEKRGNDWEIVDKIPLRKEDVKDSYYDYDDPKEREKNKFDLKPVYGYTPEIEKEVEVEIEVLRQCVDDLDLTAVIKAINGI